MSRQAKGAVCSLVTRHLYWLTRHGAMKHAVVQIDDRGFIDGETPVEDARKAWILSPNPMSEEQAERELYALLS